MTGNPRDIIFTAIGQSVDVKQLIQADELLLETISMVAIRCTDALSQGNKIMFCGNGGSAADAQHLAAELSGRFYRDRPPLAAVALTVNTSFLTAVANDYSFDEVFARMLKSIGHEGDVLFGLSTSGNSENVIRAMQEAKSMKIITVGLTGLTGGKMAACSDILVKVPSTDTARIQESHILIGHIVCELIEKSMFPA
ncbi:MAG: D-sedoheptulose 7-phosphate isomerase [Bacteroidales bacterium]|nr:D-sedoheptulose 7-phosphate isomerase [Bacteroidales bacterium]